MSKFEFGRLINNWDAWSLEPSLDQSHHLPEPEYVNLFNLGLKGKMKHPAEFNQWLADVTRALDSVGLRALISDTARRPVRLDNSSMRWVLYSKQVALWLETTMTVDMAASIKAQPGPLIFADSFMKKAKRCFQV
ncbi:hypothetical protein N7466_005552 [Penicillium verhagenii]|uniref:uncharacterized protein n=1 Tax=Penicillium verhagenii TaxID=1562060 RepID=UPI002545A7EA|nr:uncharacterized protein N7466_005552 [Penicillium verhagenii]KAJ5930059.1 hypothetical protein N7466_005552 [Penicillium verhagenii]